MYIYIYREREIYIYMGSWALLLQRAKVRRVLTGTAQAGTALTYHMI